MPAFPKGNGSGGSSRAQKKKRASHRSGCTSVHHARAAVGAAIASSLASSVGARPTAAAQTPRSAEKLARFPASRIVPGNGRVAIPVRRRLSQAVKPLRALALQPDITEPHEKACQRRENRGEERSEQVQSHVGGTRLPWRDSTVNDLDPGFTELCGSQRLVQLCAQRLVSRARGSLFVFERRSPASCYVDCRAFPLQLHCQFPQLRPDRTNTRFKACDLCGWRTLLRVQFCQIRTGRGQILREPLPEIVPAANLVLRRLRCACGRESRQRVRRSLEPLLRRLHLLL